MHRVLMEEHWPDIAGRWHESQVWIGGSRFRLHEADSSRHPMTGSLPGWLTWPRSWRGETAHRLADLLIQHASDRLVDDGVWQLIGKGARDRVWEAPDVISALDG